MVKNKFLRVCRVLLFCGARGRKIFCAKREVAVWCGGQSLIEILIAMTIGALFIIAAVSIITPALKINTQTYRVQTGVGLAKELLENVRVWSEGDWHNVSNLATTSANRYFLNASVSPFVVATGTESVLTDGVTSGLVGYWKFDEATGTVAHDYSGNNAVGTLSGSPIPTWVVGQVGGALGFNGSNMVTLPNISLANMPYTVSAWIYKNDTNDFNIVGGGAGGINANAHYIVRGSRFYFGNYGCDVGGNLPINSGQWYYVDFVMDSSQKQSIYVDGSLDAGPTMTCGYYQSYVDKIGSSCCGGTGSGIIDDIRIYNRALSASEIGAIYKAVVFTRYFYVDDVMRDTSDLIVTPGGSPDPSTKKIAVFYGWPQSATSVISEYLTRNRNNVLWQTDWSGGQGQNDPATTTNNKFSTSMNMDYTTSTGSLYIKFP